MSSKQFMSFVTLCLSGEAFVTDIDDWVDNWHAGIPESTGLELQDYLGMTANEYSLWVRNARALRLIVDAHRRGATLEELEASDSGYALAARSLSDESGVNSVISWLRDQGHLNPA